MNELVYKGQGDQVLTTSLKVAEVFGKEHSSVLRSIDTLASKITDTQCVNLFTDTSVEVQQPNGGVRHNRVVVMNRDGFTLLAMGFNGKKSGWIQVGIHQSLQRNGESVERAESIQAYVRVGDSCKIRTGTS